MYSVRLSNAIMYLSLVTMQCGIGACWHVSCSDGTDVRLARHDTWNKAHDSMPSVDLVRVGGSSSFHSGSRHKRLWSKRKITASEKHWYYHTQREYS